MNKKIFFKWFFNESLCDYTWPIDINLWAGIVIGCDIIENDI